MDKALATALRDARQRLLAKGLLPAERGSVSLRPPGRLDKLLMCGADGDVRPCAAPFDATAALHAAIYRLRPDVGAIVVGGASFGGVLAALGGAMPVLFDEQARHLGRMKPAAGATDDAGLAAALREGGNALLVGGMPVCLGTTCQRMVFNAELFEKCAKAYVLAASTGDAVAALPWWVCHIANGRLMKDERRAAQRFAAGRLPEEVRGY